MASVARMAVTIAASGTTSDAAHIANLSSFGIQMPATFSGASISFLVSADGGATFQDLYEYDRVADDGSSRKVILEVTQGLSYDLPPALEPWGHFKIVSASTEGANRDLVVIGKRP